jgi:hypothetical protein
MPALLSGLTTVSRKCVGFTGILTEGHVSWQNGQPAVWATESGPLGELTPTVVLRLRALRKREKRGKKKLKKEVMLCHEMELLEVM